MNKSLDDLVAEYFERRENGELLAPEEFAGEHSKLGERLLRALREVQEMESLLPSGCDLLPANVGRYRVLDEIGRGGMGVVLRVGDSDRPGPPPALELLSFRSQITPLSLDRFRREGEVLRRLSHPGIVRVHEVGALDGRPYLVMELVEGRNLAEIIDEAARLLKEEGCTRGVPRCSHLSLPGEDSAFRRVARVGAKLARAAGAAHRCGLVHRDIKPGNVIVTSTGEPVLIDFGLVGGDAGPTLTHTGDVLGSPAYMAPEQGKGERADQRTDVFGIGALLYEMLTLSPPRTARDPLDVLNKVRNLPLHSVRRRNPTVPRDLERVVRRAVSFRRSRRYADAESLAADLDTVATGQRVSTRPASPAELLDDLWLSRRRLMLGMAMVLLIAATGLTFQWRHRATDERDAALGKAMERAVLAVADSEEEGLRSAVQELLTLNSKDPLVELLAARSQGGVPAGSADPLVAKLIEGEQRRLSGRPAAAMTAFLKALEKDPAASLPVVLLAKAAVDSGDLDRAELEVTAAVRRFPRSAGLRWAPATALKETPAASSPRSPRTAVTLPS